MSATALSTKVLRKCAATSPTKNAGMDVASVWQERVLY